MNLSKGQKADLTKGRDVRELKLELGWTTAFADIEIDGAAFLLSDRDICEEDADFVFYGQPVHASGAVRHEGKEGRRETLTVLPRSIPDRVHKIALTLTIHEGEENGRFFRDVSDIYVRALDAHSGQELLRYGFGEELDRETAIVAAELYRHNGEWKLAAIGSGYDGGLEALCRSYGLDVAENEQSSEPAPPETAASPEAAVPVQTTPKGPLSEPMPTPADVPSAVSPKIELSKPSASSVVLQKIELSKPGSISIRKSASALAMLVWENPRKDLDLYGFYVTKSGECGKVYYKNRGSGKRAPYIELDQDARGAGQETISIYRTDELKYVLFCAYSAVSNGFGSFKAMKARAVVDNGEGQRVETWLQKKNAFAYWVAIAKIDFTGEDSMEVSQVETYSKSGVENSPLLYEDGRFEMNVGPIEFKDR
ncbi:TerD family protein [Saccharibacillus sacchari]|uniref:TerD family protein n=1 Tax=Saccharibacillus sacchari TaxID=456493 RepID=A0ACC6PG37_9BACL